MSKFGSLESSDEPLLIELIDAATGEVIRDCDGKAAYVKVHADDSRKGREFEKVARAERLEQTRRGTIAPSAPVDQLEFNIRKAAFLTTEWYLVDPDTKQEIAVPLSVDNAREFYSLPATNWFAQVWLKVINNANFMKRSAKASTSSQSGVSAMAES